MPADLSCALSLLSSRSSATFYPRDAFLPGENLWIFVLVHVLFIRHLLCIPLSSSCSRVPFCSEFEITTRSAGRNALQSSTTGDIEEDEDEEELINGNRRRKVTLMPSVDTTHTIYYRGHWLRITRRRRSDGWNGTCDELTISVVARNNAILKSLVLEAKKEYEKDAEHRVHIFMADVYGSWRWNGARQKVSFSVR